MSASPFTFVPVFMGLALHIAGGAAPSSPQAQCFANAVADVSAWRAEQLRPARPDRAFALHPVAARGTAAFPCIEEVRRMSCLSGDRQALAPPAPVARAAREKRLAALVSR